MSFSYGYGSNLVIDPIRMMIFDTNPNDYTFEDSEIIMGYQIEAQVFISPQFFDGYLFGGTQGIAAMPTVPVSWRRIAATMLESSAANYARLANQMRVLDIQVNTALAAQELRAIATQLRENDDNSGSFAIIEQCADPHAYIQRYWKTVQRQSA